MDATDHDAVVAVGSVAFGEPEQEQPPFPLDWSRTAGVRASGGELAAVRSSHRFDLPVPGGSVPAAGLTWVGVDPVHSRRGLLRTMVTDHLRHCAERGEVVLVLGGTSLAALAAAGLVTELVPGALARASTAFGWPLAPACTWDF